MIKLKSLIENLSGYEFIGFHRQKHKRPSEIDDIFFVGGNGSNYYGKMHFREILDSLYNKDRDEAMKMGFLDFDWSNQYSDEYEEMEETVADWLTNKGYRWMFVTENRPHDITGYGDYIYKVYFRRQDVLHIIDDPYGASDIAYAYVYHINNPPKVEEYTEDNV